MFALIGMTVAGHAIVLMFALIGIELGIDEIRASPLSSQHAPRPCPGAVCLLAKSMSLIESLGLDELGRVLEHLDLPARCSALRVCTTFHCAGMTQPHIWRECDFGGIRKMLCDEDVVRVLRRAGAHLTGLQLHGPQLTCAALLPLKACFGLQHVDLTGCVRVDALSLVAALPAADSFQLSSLMVDGINCQSLNDGAVCKLKALVGRGNIDISKCSLFHD